MSKDFDTSSKVEADPFETIPHLKNLMWEAKTVNPNSADYWKLRCRYLEKHLDTTYGEQERNNCFRLYMILQRR